MWAAWMPIGFLLLATKRYAKGSWSLMHYLHAIIGYMVLTATLIATFNMFKYFNWEL